MLGAVGFFAHLSVPPEALVDASTRAFRQDLVMTVYLKTMFPDWVFTFISVVLLAAAMSTLDGLLVSLSTITSNDLVLNVVERREHFSEEQHMAFALKGSHIVLIVIANLEPPRLLGIFGQTGVYGLAAAAAPPLLLGVMFHRVPVALAWIGSAAALVLHFLLFFQGAAIFPDSTLTFGNPGVTASIASLVTIPPMLFIATMVNRRP